MTTAVDDGLEVVSTPADDDGLQEVQISSPIPRAKTFQNPFVAASALDPRAHAILDAQAQRSALLEKDLPAITSQRVIQISNTQSEVRSRDLSDPQAAKHVEDMYQRVFDLRKAVEKLGPPPTTLVGDMQADGKRANVSSFSIPADKAEYVPGKGLQFSNKAASEVKDPVAYSQALQAYNHAMAAYANRMHMELGDYEDLATAAKDEAEHTGQLSSLLQSAGADFRNAWQVRPAFGPDDENTLAGQANRAAIQEQHPYQSAATGGAAGMTSPQSLATIAAAHYGGQMMAPGSAAGIASTLEGFGIPAGASAFIGNRLTQALIGAGTNVALTEATKGDRTITTEEAHQVVAIGAILPGVSEGLAAIFAKIPGLVSLVNKLPPAMQAVTKFAGKSANSGLAMAGTNYAAAQAEGRDYTAKDFGRDFAAGVSMHIALGGQDAAEDFNKAQNAAKEKEAGAAVGASHANDAVPPTDTTATGEPAETVDAGPTEEELAAAIAQTKLPETPQPEPTPAPETPAPEPIARPIAPAESLPVQSETPAPKPEPIVPPETPEPAAVEEKPKPATIAPEANHGTNEPGKPGSPESPPVLPGEAKPPGGAASGGTPESPGPGNPEQPPSGGSRRGRPGPRKPSGKPANGAGGGAGAGDESTRGGSGGDKPDQPDGAGAPQNAPSAVAKPRGKLAEPEQNHRAGAGELAPPGEAEKTGGGGTVTPETGVHEAWEQVGRSAVKALKALVGYRDVTSGDVFAGAGVGNKLADSVIKFGVDLVKALAVTGKHGFEDFVRWVSVHAEPTLRKEILSKARRYYQAIRDHADTVAAGLHTGMTQDEDLPARSLKGFQETAGMAKLTPEEQALRDSIRGAGADIAPKPPTEAQILREQTIPGKSVKAAIRASTGLSEPPSPMVTDKEALAAKLTIEAALSNKAWMAADARAKITEAAKVLPRELRGDFLHAVSTAKNETDVKNAVARMENNLALHNLRESHAAAVDLLARTKLTKLPPTYRIAAQEAAKKLQGSIDQVQSHYPPGAEARNAYRDMLDGYSEELQQAVARGRRYAMNLIAKAGASPAETSEIQKPAWGRRLADAAHNLATTVERFSHLRRDYSPAVQDGAEGLVQVQKETVGETNRFVSAALPKDPKRAAVVMADLVRLGWHNRINDLRNTAYERAIERGMEPDVAEKVAMRVGTGIPDTGAAGAAKIKADPEVRKAAEYWLKTIAPAQEANLARSGQDVKGWTGEARKLADPIDGLMMNLPPDRNTDPAHFGTRRRSYDQSAVLLDPTQGIGEYQKDFLKVIQQNIAYPIRARARAEFATAVEKGGFALDPNDPAVRQTPDGRAYVTVKGKEYPAEARMFDDAQGQPQPKFVPLDIVKAHDFQPAPSEPDKIAAKIVNGIVTARLAVGADVGFHVWREMGNVGALLAREGHAVSHVPWLGRLALAAEHAYRMAGTPEGDMQQILAERGGYDRGTGYYLTEHDPKTIVQKTLQYGHQILFGPKRGVDTNLRRVVGASFQRVHLGPEAYQRVVDQVNAGRLTPHQGADAIGDLLGAANRLAMKNFVNRSLGENNHLLRAEFLNKLAFVMPFIGQHVGPLPTEIGRFVTANLPFRSVVEHWKRGDHARAVSSVSGSLLSGALGTYLAANLLNYAATSQEKDDEGNKTGAKWMWENPEGHKLTPKVWPGVYLNTFAPGDSRPARLTGVQTAVNDGSVTDGVKDIGRNWVNEIASMVPFIQPLGAAAGIGTYVNRRGELGRPVPEDVNPFSFGRNTVDAIIDRIKGAEDPQPVGQAIAEDVAGAAGQRIDFERQPKRVPGPPRLPSLRH